jgi:hypothetical protein
MTIIIMLGENILAMAKPFTCLKQIIEIQMGVATPNHLGAY